MSRWFRWGRRARRFRKDLDQVRASQYFDAAWYRSRYGDKVGRDTAAEHYLRYGAALGYDPGPLFSTSGYLADHPDVAQSGMNPLMHFLRHGQFEGRLPRARHTALGLDEALWGGADEAEVCAALDKIVESIQAPEQERLYAAWALVRWHAANGNWPHAQRLLPILRQADPRFSFLRALPLVEISALVQSNALDEAEQRLTALLAQAPANHDWRLAKANLVAVRGMDAERLAVLSEIFTSSGLSPLAQRELGRPLSLENLVGLLPAQRTEEAFDHPLVTVLVPAFNAEDTLPTALEALCRQSWRNLEVLVIDDASTDRTAEVAEQFVARDGRFRFLRRPFCEGAYVARNTGLRQARGELITVHDADDWSHPEKIERQVRHLLSHPATVACTSHWVRCSDSLEFGTWRAESGWIELNISSLMFRRRVFDELGFWDRVKVGADAEYYQRILRGYGKEAVAEVLSGVPLAFGRMRPQSLTQSGETHINTSIAGVRKLYIDAASLWHRRASGPAELYLSECPARRPFSIPPALITEAKEYEGTMPRRPDKANVLLVAHAWSERLFGAERSFVDLVTGFAELGLNVYVAVPEGGGDDHRAVLLRHCITMTALPYPWWRRGRDPARGVEANFQHLIRRHHIDLLYANTVSLWEPLQAARRCGTRTAVHVHELPTGNPALCESLGADPEAIRRHVLGLADHLVAVSTPVASWLDAPDRTSVVPNTFDPELLRLPQRSGRRFQVALFGSSNAREKGLADFVELARILSVDEHNDILFLLIGRGDGHIDALKAQQARGEVPANLRFAGYAESPIDAIAQADVVVNLAHTQEAFGRSVLEAMAGGRPVVCYAWGALPELVIDGETGYLVPLGNLRAAAERVRSLHQDPERRRAMGEAARRRAEDTYGRAAYLNKLRASLSALLPHQSAPPA